MNAEAKIRRLVQRCMAARGAIALLQQEELPFVVASALARAHAQILNAEDSLHAAEHFACQTPAGARPAENRRPEEAPAPLSVAETKDGHGEKP